MLLRNDYAIIILSSLFRNYAFNQLEIHWDKYLYKQL